MTTAKSLNDPQTRKAAGAAVGGVGAIVIAAAALIAPWEGKRNDPYLDIVKVPTVCYGETQVVMRRYTDAECVAMLYRAIEKRYAAPVFACVPGLRMRPYAAAASISLAYNIGSTGFCRSTAARRFNAGDWRGGCAAFGSWVKAGGRVLPGLVNRRRAEMRICMKGL